MEGITGAVTIYFCRNCLCGFPAYLFIENKKRSAGVSYFTKGTDRKAIVKRVLTHPCIIAVFLGMILMLTQVSLPSFLDAALKNIGNCNTAMSMLVIGTILADVKPKEMLDKSIFLFSGLRLVLIPLVVYVGCLAFRVDSEAKYSPMSNSLWNA